MNVSPAFAFLLVSSLLISIEPSHADPIGGAPPLERKTGVPGTFVVVSTFTDEDGDGRYDRLVTELHEKDENGALILRTTDIDTNNDGKAEKSVSELHVNAQGKAKFTMTRERSANDADWASETGVTDSDQNGKPEKVEQFTSVAHDGKFDKTVTKTDANENGIFETVETLTAPLGGPGKGRFDQRITETFNDTSGALTDRRRETGSFGNIPVAVERPAVLHQPNVKAELPAVGEGLVSASPEGSSFAGFLSDAIGSTTHPLDDPAMLASFSYAAGISGAATAQPFVLASADGEVLLRGQLGSMRILGSDVPGIHLDPAADLAFIANFDLATLRLAGVSVTSPFYDPTLPGVASPFISTLDERLRGLVAGSLEFRFEPFDPVLFPTDPGETPAGVPGIAQLDVVSRVSEPPPVLLWLLAFALLARARGTRLLHVTAARNR